MDFVCTQLFDSFFFQSDAFKITNICAVRETNQIWCQIQHNYMAKIALMEIYNWCDAVQVHDEHNTKVSPGVCATAERFPKIFNAQDCFPALSFFFFFRKKNLGMKAGTGFKVCSSHCLATRAIDWCRILIFPHHSSPFPPKIVLDVFFFSSCGSRHASGTWENKMLILGSREAHPLCIIGLSSDHYNAPLAGPDMCSFCSAHYT